MLARKYLYYCLVSLPQLYWKRSNEFITLKESIMAKRVAVRPRVDSNSGGRIIPASVAVVVNRPPTIYDGLAVGTNWVDLSSNTPYILCGFTRGAAIWVTSPAAGAGNFTAVTINPGNLTLAGGTSSIIAAGNITAAGQVNAATLSTSGLATLNSLAVTGDETVGGSLTVTGTAIFNGGLNFTSTDPIHIESTDDVLGAITLTVNGGTAESIIIQSLQGTTDNSIDIYSANGGINVTPNTNLFLGNSQATGITEIFSGAGGMVLDATAGGGFDLKAATGTINISGDAFANSILIGTGNAVKTIGIGGIAANIIGIGDVQTGGSIELGAAMTTGTITLGSTAAQTGNFILAPGSGAQTITLGNNNGAKTINIGNGVSGNAISIGNGINTTAQTINIAGGASGANSTVDILSGNKTAGTSTLNLATGTGNKVVHIADSAGANTVTLGSTNTTSTTTINAGSGGVVVVSGGIASVASIIAATGGSPRTNNVNVGQCIFSGFTTAVGAQETLVINNTKVTANSVVLVSVSNSDPNNGTMGVAGFFSSANTLTVQVQNFDLNNPLVGNIIVNFWVLQS